MTDRIKIRQETMEVNLDAITFYDGQFFIAFIPSLNIVSHNKDEKLAKSQLDDAVELFFDYWTESGKIHEKLLDLGWEPKKSDSKLIPYPSESGTVHIPLNLLTTQGVRPYNTYKIPTRVPAIEMN